eukprot:snap_masked-scaffold_21-processed-gene-3.16-mRNA-1 protein AED:1.00 eAED:1.00 QI:0/0/0/0/1/1/2/0/59
MFASNKEGITFRGSIFSDGDRTFYEATIENLGRVRTLESISLEFNLRVPTIDQKTIPKT